jgi:hypothetical protein
VEGEAETAVDADKASIALPVEEDLNDLDDGELDDLISGKTLLSPVTPKPGAGRKPRPPPPAPTKRSARIATRLAEKEMEEHTEAESEVVAEMGKLTPRRKGKAETKSNEEEGENDKIYDDWPDKDKSDNNKPQWTPNQRG